MIKRHYNKIISIALAIIFVVSYLYVATYNPIKIEASANILSIGIEHNPMADLSGTEIIEKVESLTETTLTKVTDDKYVIDYDGTTKSISIENLSELSFQKLTIESWDECSIGLILDTEALKAASSIIDSKTSVISKTEDTLSTSDDNVTVEYKATGIVDGFNELGGIDVIVTLNQAISATALNFYYNTELCTPYLQPALTQEYTDGWNDEFNCYISVTESQVIVSENISGKKILNYPTVGSILCERPIHVVNSVAFYADGKSGHVLGQTNYATGKIGHLYRMLMVDSKGSTAYADWQPPKDGLLLLQLDEKFLSTAVYPITIKPMGDTFGYTSVGGGSISSSTDSIRGGLYSIGANGTSVSISAYLKRLDTSWTLHHKGVLYSTDGYKQDEGAAVNITSATGAWYTSALGGISLTSGTNYIIGAFLDAVSTSYGWFYDTVTDAEYAKTSLTYPTFPSEPVTFTHTSDRQVSIYCEYTASASYDISNTPTSKAFGIVTASTTYYAKGSAPSNPVDDSECTFTITNSGGICDLDMKVSDFTGGNGWNIVSTSPSTDEVRITSYYSGQNPASGLILTNTDQEFLDAFAASSTKKFDFKMETGTFGDGAEKTATLTITARAET